MPALRSRAPFQWVKCIFFMPLQIARAFVCWASIQTGDCEQCGGAAGCRRWDWVCAEWLPFKKKKKKRKCYDCTCLEMHKQLLVPGELWLLLNGQCCRGWFGVCGEPPVLAASPRWWWKRNRRGSSQCARRGGRWGLRTAAAWSRAHFAFRLGGKICSQSVPVSASSQEWPGFELVS